MLYEFWEPVLISRNPDDKHFPSQSDLIKGRFIGFAWDTGHHFTFKVLTDDTRKIVTRSHLIRPENRVAGKKITKAPGDPDVEQFVRSNRDPKNPDTVLPTIPKLDPEDCIGRTVLMPTQEDGQRHRAKILERVDEYKNELQSDPEFIRYRVQVGTQEEWEEIVSYNELMNLIDQDDQDGQWNFKSILAHSGPLTANDPGYRGSAYNVLVLWETGEQTFEPLKTMSETYDGKLALAVYARKNNLLDLPGWKQFKSLARREKKLIRLVNQAKLQSFRLTPIYMYGYLVPRNYDQAVQLDKENGNTKWMDCTKLELIQVLGYGTFNDHGLGGMAPEGFKKISVHFVYAVKHDGRHKARLVAGGHLTDVPIDSVYSSVVSLKGVRVISFLAELNGLKLWSTDIGNAYLESPTLEKVYIIGGPEFASVGLEGHTLVIVKALYGLKSSGLRWWEILA
ncbi:MAG TPA: reverse transcriptase domain-containing protein, partial [Methylomicrobium sp.]|nr:reverse transcriptase domain-containing protein [Methylomicrobium sp.]